MLVQVKRDRGDYYIRKMSKELHISYYDINTRLKISPRNSSKVGALYLGPTTMTTSNIDWKNVLVFAMLKGMLLQKRHLPTTLFASCFSFLFTIDRMEGCAPSLVLGTTKGEVVTEGELVESLSLPPVPYMPVVLEDLAIPSTTISSLRVAASSLSDAERRNGVR